MERKSVGRSWCPLLTMTSDVSILGNRVSKPLDSSRLPRKRQNKRPFKLGLGEGTKGAYVLLAAVLIECPISTRISIRSDAAPHEIWHMNCKYLYMPVISTIQGHLQSTRNPTKERAPNKLSRGRTDRRGSIVPGLLRPE